jgi:hypothetical protein
MELKQQLKVYELILLQKLCRVQEKESVVEVIMILVFGSLCGLYNPNQVAEQLGIPPGRLYDQLKQMSAHRWRQLLKQLMEEKAIEKLKGYEESSAATKSRLATSLSIDDTVIRRLGQALSYVWVWYSGQFKRALTGQDLLGIVLKVNGEIIPLRLVLVSKKGRGPTKKSEIVVKEMEELKNLFQSNGIELTRLGVSFDSWYLGKELSAQLAELGFVKQVICGKSSTILKVGRREQSLVEHYFAEELKPGWGHKTPAHRLKGQNPTFDEIAVVLFNQRRTKAFALILPAQPLRTCEALRIWFNHNAVETFWKRLKQWLGLGKMQLRDRAGAWADVTLRVLAYLLALPLLATIASSLPKLSHWLRRQATFAQLILEHFQPSFLATYGYNHS